MLAGTTPVLVHNEGGDLPASGSVRVGSWMHPSEYEKYVKTGMVQPRGGDVSFVVYPANPNTYTAAPVGDVYVEFDVPVESLNPGGKKGWYRIPGPNALESRLAAKQGKPRYQLPAAGNVQQVGDPKC